MKKFSVNISLDFEIDGILNIKKDLIVQRFLDEWLQKRTGLSSEDFNRNNDSFVVFANNVSYEIKRDE